jgi:hypothetical protein
MYSNLNLKRLDSKLLLLTAVADASYTGAL